MSIVAWTNSNSGFAIVLLTFVYSLANCLMAWQMRRSNRLAAASLAQALRLDAARSRPYVGFHIERRGNRLVAVLRNSGLTAAFRVQVAAIPRLVKPTAGGDAPLALSSNLITLLAPGQVLEEHLGECEVFFARYVPPAFTGTVTYADAAAKVYEEKLDLDLAFAAMGGAPEAHADGAALEQIAHEVGKLARSQRGVS